MVNPHRSLVEELDGVVDCVGAPGEEELHDTEDDQDLPDNVPHKEDNDMAPEEHQVDPEMEEPPQVEDKGNHTMAVVDHGDGRVERIAGDLFLDSQAVVPHMDWLVGAENIVKNTPVAAVLVEDRCHTREVAVDLDT